MQSPVELPLTGAGLGESTVAAEPSIREAGPPAAGLQTWTVSVPGVLLAKAANDFELWVRNRDGLSPRSTIVVHYRKPPPEKPLVKLLEPAKDVTVSEPPLYRLRVEVRSKSEPAQVTVLRNDSPLKGVRAPKKVAEGVYRVRAGESRVGAAAQHAACTGSQRSRRSRRSGSDGDLYASHCGRSPRSP